MQRRFIPFAIPLFLLNACALTVDTIDVEYKPGAAATVLPDANPVVVNLDVQDVRNSHQDRVSSKKNGFGVEMAAIVSKRGVKSMVTDAFRTELELRGFSVGESPVTVRTDIHKFYSDFKVGFFAGESVGEVTFFVQVEGLNSKTFHANTYTGEGEITGVMLMGGENAKKSIELAFATTVQKVMMDERFIQAILEAHSAASSSGSGEMRSLPRMVPAS